MLKVALTNLGKYNEGSLVYTWLELPATAEEIDAAMDEIGVAPGTKYEEYFITDYEAPFQIDEYASLSRLNRIAEALEGLNIPEVIFEGTYDVEDVVNLAHELESAGYIDDAADYVGDIVSTDELDGMVTAIVEESGWGWIRVRSFLQGIGIINPTTTR